MTAAVVSILGSTGAGLVLGFAVGALRRALA